MRIARRAKADMFISLHSDAAGSASARGAAAYVLSSSGVRKSRERAHDHGDWFLPESEYRTEEINEILFDISMDEKLQRSNAFAGELLSEVRRVSPLLRDGPEHKGFLVLLDAQFPAVLFEMGFLSNRRDSANLNSSAHREKLMRAIVHALEDQFPPCGQQPGTQFAANATSAR